LSISSVSPNVGRVEVEPAYLSIDDTAKFFAMSTWWVRDMMRRGRLQVTKNGARTLIVFASAKALAADLSKPATKPSSQPRGQRGRFASKEAEHG
jgi:hypothetical protein